MRLDIVGSGQMTFHSFKVLTKDLHNAHVEQKYVFIRYVSIVCYVFSVCVRAGVRACVVF